MLSVLVWFLNDKSQVFSHHAGNTGTSLQTYPNVYLSADAGVTWREVRNEMNSIDFRHWLISTLCAVLFVFTSL